MNQQKFLIGALALNVVLAVAAIYFYSDNRSRGTILQNLTAESDSLQEKIITLEEQNKTLRGRLNALDNNSTDDAATERLKMALDEKDAEITRLKQENEQGGRNRGGRRQGPPDRNENEPRLSMEERMEQLRTQNPEQYERIMEMRDRMENARIARDEKRNQLLNNLDKRKLSSAQNQTIETYKTLLENQENIRRNMEENGGGRESFMMMMQNQNSLNQLSTQVQDILIEQYANSLSNGSGAEAAEEIRNILNATSTGFPGGGPGMGGPGGPGMGGPGMGGPGMGGRRGR